jgi:hypothetical protein
MRVAKTTAVKRRSQQQMLETRLIVGMIRVQSRRTKVPWRLQSKPMGMAGVQGMVGAKYAKGAALLNRSFVA